MIDIVPTVVPDSVEGVTSVFRKYSAFAPVIHIDAADGKFAPNTTWMPAEGDKFSEGVYEAHIMVEDARGIGAAFARAGVPTVIGHCEAIKGDLSILDAWREAGATKVGVAALLQTPLETLNSYIGHVDYILLMTIVRIGVQGIPFEESGIARVAEFHARHPKVTIAVDGGVSEKNAALLVKAGARHLSVGSAIAKADNPAEAYARIMAAAEAAL
jgi:ribulose-phosphate 3-epimerase